ncbi:MAG TPA: TetR family transcriptional regulator [Solirubrobacteraceae bacterium]|jgi:AcrR family transcriptional regulator|nr:TetR family transcriptional regulator [Solirubrobacteraceae bacterium]
MQSFIKRADGLLDARRPGPPAAARHSREQASLLAEFQRSRLLRAALEEACERGRGETAVAHIVARARVSRKTFYESFDNREACFAAVFEQCVAQIADVAAPAFAGDGSWSQRLRAALLAVLALFEADPDLGVFALAHVVADASLHPELRARVLTQVLGAVEEGRCEPRARAEPPPFAAELVVGGVLVVLHARLQSRVRHLGALANELMWMIVLPYLGPAAAARELLPAPPKRNAAVPRPPARTPLEGLEMRMTHRTARVLATIAEEPGASNTRIAARVGIVDQGQISKLLARLAGRGLVEKAGSHSLGAANEWRLTSLGAELEASLGRRLATAGRVPRRGDA